MVDGTPSQVAEPARAPGPDPDGPDDAAGDPQPELAHHQASAADEQVRLVEDYLERRRLMPRLRNLRAKR